MPWVFILSWGFLHELIFPAGSHSEDCMIPLALHTLWPRLWTQTPHSMRQRTRHTALCSSRWHSLSPTVCHLPVSLPPLRMLCTFFSVCPLLTLDLTSRNQHILLKADLDTSTPGNGQATWYSCMSDVAVLLGAYPSCFCCPNRLQFTFHPTIFHDPMA